MIDRDSTLSIMRQCELLGLCRSSLYYRPQPISDADLLLMRRIDELHLTHPFLGARRLARMLQRTGVEVGRRHVGTLMLLMGIETIYRKKRTSLPAEGDCGTAAGVRSSNPSSIHSRYSAGIGLAWTRS